MLLEVLLIPAFMQRLTSPQLTASMMLIYWRVTGVPNVLGGHMAYFCPTIVGALTFHLAFAGVLSFADFPAVADVPVIDGVTALAGVIPVAGVPVVAVVPAVAGIPSVVGFSSIAGVNAVACVLVVGLRDFFVHAHMNSYILYFRTDIYC
jgi:hypothetical protein